MEDNNRRPLKTRSKAWAQALAGWCCRIGLKPNTISLASVLPAAGGAVAFYFAGRAGCPGMAAALFIAAGACIQFRLLCNLLDGMIAVEGGLKSKSGELYNDVPDRVADPLFLIGAGYSVEPLTPAGPVLGYVAALLAVGTAYIRVLGAATGVGHHFLGPMAKQHRMAILTLGCIIAAVEAFFWPRGWTILVVLVIIIAGSVLTLFRRLYRIAYLLESQP